MDTVSKKQRHLNMSHIKGKDTSLELKVRKRLYHDGYRYRVNVPNLPGKPDIVLSKYNTVIFINGCFWHRHNCKLATTPVFRGLHHSCHKGIHKISQSSEMYLTLFFICIILNDL